VHWVKHQEQWGLYMVYKGVKYLCYLSISAYLGGETYNPDKLRAKGISPAAYLANKTGVGIQQKASVINNKSAYSVAAQAGALTNQAGGNIGFTYE